MESELESGGDMAWLPGVVPDERLCGLDTVAEGDAILGGVEVFSDTILVGSDREWQHK